MSNRSGKAARQGGPVSDPRVRERVIARIILDQSGKQADRTSPRIPKRIAWWFALVRERGKIFPRIACIMVSFIVCVSVELDLRVRYQSCGPTLDLRALYLQGILYTARTLRNGDQRGHFANRF